MIYIGVVILAIAVLAFQKLIREGKLPKPNGPNGLPTRIVGLIIFAASIWLLISLNTAGGSSRPGIFTILAAVGYGVFIIIKAKQRQKSAQAGIPKQDNMKRSLMFLAAAIIVAILLVILTLPGH